LGISHSCPAQATTVADAHDAFHVYSLVWRPTQLLLCIDGETVHSFERGEAPVRRSKEAPGDDDASSRASGDSGATRGAEPECTDWPFDQRFFLLINLAVGGTWGGKHGVDDAALPASLEIAYVRVFQER